MLGTPLAHGTLMPNFLLGLNTSTIQPASLLDKIRIAHQAGYDAIELWITDVEDYLSSGGSLADVSKALGDTLLLQPSMIYLKDWWHQDAARDKQGMETCRRRLEIAYRLGVARMVAGPPAVSLPLGLLIERYGRLLELSIDVGVPASIEFLGFVQGVNTIEVAWQICQGVGHPQATLTSDAWHLFRGGSNLATLDQIPAERVSIVHWNDAPAQPPRTEQTDADRVMPGDGILDLPALAEQLARTGYSRTLSLELFHRGYWQQDPMTVATTGLAKMKRSVGL
jgi:sugar phosphate isomerase/epimerase